MNERDERGPSRCRVVVRDGRLVVLIDDEPRLALPAGVVEQRSSS